MNTVAELPLVRMLVEMTVAGTQIPGVRVERVRDTELILALPDDADPQARPLIGDAVTLRWPAGGRGRYIMTGTVVPAPDDENVGVVVKGEPELEQRREFFRGGGGERIRLRHAVETDADDPAAPAAPAAPATPAGPAGPAGPAADVPAYHGWVQDLSERGARSHFADVRVRVGDRLRAQIDMDGQTVEVAGTVLRIDLLPDTVGAYSMRIEVVVMFDSGEHEARAIRRYVFRQQLLARGPDDH